jgi:hypothetical protein
MLLDNKVEFLLKETKMQTKIEHKEIHQQRVEKLERAKVKVDEIKAKVNGLEKELLEIKKLDKILMLRAEMGDIIKSRRETIYKVDDILFFGKLAYQRFPSHKLYNWKEAKENAQKLKISKYGDWRLPTIAELEKLLTRSRLKNSKGDRHYVIQDYLESMPTDSCFWSATEENELYAWVVDFGKGYDYWREKTLAYHTLFVHDI